MPTLAELMPLERLRAQACDPQPAPPKKKVVPPQLAKKPPVSVQKNGAQKPAFGQPQKPAFGQPQQKPAFGQPQQRPGMGNMQPQNPNDPLQLDQIGQLADQIQLAVARLERIKQFAMPNQDQQLGAAKVLLRLAHTKHVTGDQESVPRHLANASTIMNRIQTKTLGLPQATTPAKLKKRNQGRDMREQVRQGKQQQDLQKKLTPNESGGAGPQTPAWQKRRTAPGAANKVVNQR
jgi:hypothetical protein